MNSLIKTSIKAIADKIILLEDGKFECNAKEQSKPDSKITIFMGL